MADQQEIGVRRRFFQRFEKRVRPAAFQIISGIDDDNPLVGQARPRRQARLQIADLFDGNATF